MKILTNTDDNNPSGQTLHRSCDPPLKLDARNYNPADPLSMPDGIRPFLDAVLQDVITKTDGITSFSESMTGDTRVQFVFPPTAQMPYPAFAYTNYNYDLTTCYFNRNLLISQPDTRKQTALAKELLIRVLNIQTNSGDINMLSYFDGTTATVLHKDEAEVIKVVYTLPNNTNMKQYRDTIITTIPNNSPTPFTFIEPNGIAIDNNGNLEIITSPSTKRDIEGDLLKKIVRLYGEGIDTVMTTTADVNILPVKSSRLKQNTIYNLEGWITDGIDTISVANKQFTAANIPPENFTANSLTNVDPTTVTKVSWTKPADIGALSYTINVTGNGLNLSFNNVVDTFVNIPANTLIQNGNYTIEVIAKDDHNATNTANATIGVKNLPPGAFTVSSLTTIDPTIANKIPSGIPSDVGTLTYKFTITGENQNLVYTNTVNEITVPANILKQNGNYNIAVLVTDDHGATNTANATLSVKNLAPTNLSFPSLTEIDPRIIQTITGAEAKDIGKLKYDFIVSGNGLNFVYSDTLNKLVIPANILKQNGEYNIAVLVTDDHEATNSANATLSVMNLPPESFNANSLSEVDPTIINKINWTKPKDIGSLLYDIAIKGTNFNLTYANVADTFVNIPANTLIQNGNYNIEVIAKDDHNATNKANATISVKNLPPGNFGLNSLIDVDPTIANKIPCEKPSDVGKLNYTFTITGENQNLIYTDTINEITVPANILKQNGNYNIAVLVTDDHGATNSANATLSVMNLPPESFTANSLSNVDPTIVNKINWTKPKDIGSLLYDIAIKGANFNLTYANVADTFVNIPANTLIQNGEYTIEVIAKDDHNATNKANATLSVMNLPPENFNIPNPGTLNPSIDNIIPFNKPKDIGTLNYQVKLTGENLNETYTPTDTTILIPKNTLKQNKEYALEVIVTDDHGATNTAKIDLVSGNLAPQEFSIANPQNNSELDATIDNLINWYKSKDDDAITYKIIATSLTEPNIEYTTTDTAYNIPANSLTPGKAYKLKVVADDNQTTTESNNIIDISTITGINDILNENIKYYPNPVIDHLNFELTTHRNGSLSINIYSPDGKLVYQKKEVVFSCCSVQKLDMSAFAKGLYAVQFVLNNEAVGFIKIVKE